MMTLSFIKRCNQYNAGEVAEFEEAEAKRLIQHGFAAVVTKPIKEAAVTKEVKDDEDEDTEAAHEDSGAGHHGRSVRPHRK